jgi:cold shock CspA family protein
LSEPDRTGVVTAFDDPAGYGTVTSDDGQEHWFHCTALADGSRRVEVGTEVRFTVVPGLLGRWEAADLQPVVSTA